MNLERTIDAHPVNIYDLSVGDQLCYSSSNDGTLKAWNISTGDLVRVLAENPDEEILKLFFTTDKLYAGDIKGNVSNNYLLK